MLVDYPLYCKNIVKYTLWLKTNEQRLSLISLMYSFQLKRLELEDDPRVLSVFYMVRFFFGRTARILRMKRIFTFGKNYFDLDIAFISHKTKLFYPLYYWIYEIQSCINIKNCRDYCLTNNYLMAVLWEVNLFSEKKTNPALFDLIDPLHLKLIFNKGFITNRFLLIKSLKFIC